MEQEFVSKIVDANMELLEASKLLIEQRMDLLGNIISNHFHFQEYGNLYINNFLNEVGCTAELFFDLTSKICKLIEDFGDTHFPEILSAEDEEGVVI